MRSLQWLSLLILSGLLLQGCIIPRMAGNTVKGVARGTMTVVEGAADVATAPF